MFGRTVRCDRTETYPSAAFLYTTIAVHVAFVIDKVALGRDVGVLSLFSVSIIPPVLNTEFHLPRLDAI